jgi:hypothetical protein
MSKTLANLRDRLSEVIGDYWHSTVTTAINADTLLDDTKLANKRGGTTDDYFVDWHVLITSGNNAGTNRIVADYDGTINYRLTLQGANLTDDGTTLATYELHKYDPDEKKKVINQAARELYPILFKPVRDKTLVAGNMLPDSHFEWWTSSTALKFYKTSNASLAKTSTAGLTWGGTYSAKVTASATNGYMYVSSNEHPRLLDLADREVTFHCAAYPQSDDGAKIEIYTVKADGTTQTHTSTTSSYAGKWSILKLDDKSINDDIQYIEFRFYSVNNGEYVYFDAAWISTSGNVLELLLPEPLREGAVCQVRRQFTAHSDDVPDDMGWGARYEEVFGWKIVNDGTYKYLRLPYSYTEQRLELIGYAPLEDDLDSDTDTMSINDPQTELLIAYAAALLYESKRGVPSVDGVDLYTTEFNRWVQKAEYLKRKLRMAKPASQISWSI